MDPGCQGACKLAQFRKGYTMLHRIIILATGLMLVYCAVDTVFAEEKETKLLLGFEMEEYKKILLEPFLTER